MRVSATVTRSKTSDIPHDKRSKAHANAVGGDAPLHRRVSGTRPSEPLLRPAPSHALLIRRGRPGLRVGPDGYADVTADSKVSPDAREFSPDGAGWSTNGSNSIGLR